MKFDFKDLMSFGTFLLALLTFIIFESQIVFYFRHRKTTLIL